VESLKSGTEVVGNRCRAKIQKNKLAAPFRQAEFDLLYGRGISRGADLVDLGVETKVITKTGTFFSYGEQRLGQGRDNARQSLDDNRELADEIQARIWQTMGLTRGGPAAQPSAPAG